MNRSQFMLTCGLLVFLGTVAYSEEEKPESFETPKWQQSPIEETHPFEDGQNISTPSLGHNNRVRDNHSARESAWDYFCNETFLIALFSGMTWFRF